MKNRMIALLLAWGLLCGLAVPAGAEVMTLGVYFRGIAEQEDGTSAQVPLSGSFRVLQGGLDRGVIQAGESTVTVSGTDPVTILPMAETIPTGWDLTNAAVTVNLTDSGNVTVPILVPRLTEDTAAVVATVTQAPAEEEDQGQTGTLAEIPAADAAVGTSSVTTAVTVAPLPTATPEWVMTPVPTAEPTPEPQVSTLTASADTGVFHVKAFYDSNNNGDCSIYEKGVAGTWVYILSEAGEVITGGSTNSDGEITLPGIRPGSYRIRAVLSEEWGFNRKSKEIGLNKSIMDFSSEAAQDSELIAISAGETVERGIGLLKGVVVDGVCWLDENADGVMDASEPKIAGARITLSGQKNGLEFETYTDENGYFRVIRLRAGYYDFTSYAPEGMMFTRYSKTGGKNRSAFTTEGKTKATKTLDLNDGRDDLDQNIGFTWQGSVSGIAFLDANYNGLYDDGEQPMAGVKVTAIKQSKDEEIAVAYTDADGWYILGGLRGNTYRIRAVLPDDGCNFTISVDDPEGNHFVARDNRRENFWKDFVVQDGQNRTVNVGVIYYGAVSGTVYTDDDFSGTLSAGEKTVQGISVTLLNEKGTAVDTKTTTAKGTYSFTGLTPGKYSLRMTAKQGYAFTRQGEGNVMLNLNGGEGYSEVFEVPLGGSVAGMDAGMILPATVQGMVFADANDNGKYDSEERGLTGTAVSLIYEETGEAAFSATVTESGSFTFDAVMPGTYYLEYQLPERGIFADAAGDTRITGENGLGRGDSFAVRTGDQVSAPLCGGLIEGMITGTVFEDHDGSGTLDGADTPLAEARITLIPERGDLPQIEAVTDADGAFTLAHLHPGEYRMEMVLPGDMVTTRLTETTLPIRSGMHSQERTLSVAMGQTWMDQRVGAARPAVLRGGAWMDENNNGLREPEERPLTNIAIVVTDETTGQVFDTLYTDEDGIFEHPGMIPGTYSVAYQMEESADEPPAGDTTFRKEGARMVMTGISLAEGGAREDLVLGLVRYTAMGGMVWIDRGSGTEPLPGAKVELLDAEKNILETRTSEETGAWRFTGLMPGTYFIRAELPEGSVAAEPDDERLQTGLISILRETDGRRGTSDPIDLRMGEDQLSLNIGSVLPGTIGDYCWLDVNGNGWQDGGELGIPNVKVELMRNGRAVAETETDQYGLYFFREVYPAVYTLRVTAPEEVKPTQKRTDIYLIVSSLLETEEITAYTEEFSVASDSTNFNIDLGYVLRTNGAYPPGYGEQETMDWSKAYEGVELK